MNQTGRISTVLFDLDGTLVQGTEELHHQSYAGAARTFGVQVGPGFANEICGKSVPDVWQYLCSEYGLAATLGEFSKAKVDQFLSLLPKAVENGMVQLRPGIEETIHFIEQESIKWGVVTNGIDPEVKAILRAVKIEPRLTVTRNDVEHGKPAPDSCLEGAGRLGVPPYECLALEDSPLGAIAAARAGMVVGYRPEAHFPNAFRALRHEIRRFKGEITGGLRKMSPEKRQFIRIRPQENPLVMVKKLYYGERRRINLVSLKEIRSFAESLGADEKPPQRSLPDALILGAKIAGTGIAVSTMAEVAAGFAGRIQPGDTISGDLLAVGGISVIAGIATACEARRRNGSGRRR